VPWKRAADPASELFLVSNKLVRGSSAIADEKHMVWLRYILSGAERRIHPTPNDCESTLREIGASRDSNDGEPTEPSTWLSLIAIVQGSPNVISLLPLQYQFERLRQPFVSLRHLQHGAAGERIVHALRRNADFLSPALNHLILAAMFWLSAMLGRHGNGR